MISRMIKVDVPGVQAQTIDAGEVASRYPNTPLAQDNPDEVIFLEALEMELDIAEGTLTENDEVQLRFYANGNAIVHLVPVFGC